MLYLNIKCKKNIFYLKLEDMTLYLNFFYKKNSLFRLKIKKKMVTLDYHFNPKNFMLLTSFKNLI